MLSFAGSNWAAEEGQDFIADHNSSNVDFATIHCWPDNWEGASELPDLLCQCKARRLGSLSCLNKLLLKRCCLS